MGVHIGDNKLVISTEPKTIHFDLSRNVDKNLKLEIDSSINYTELLPTYTIKYEIRQLLCKYKHGSNIHEHGKQ